MALITCPECGKPVSDRAAACPHCGFDLNTPKCAECGAYLPEGAQACPVCGCPVDDTSYATDTPASGAITLAFPAPHSAWHDAVPPLVITAADGSTTYGVVEWNKTVAFSCPGPETLNIRRNDEDQLRRQRKNLGLIALIVAGALNLLGFVTLLFAPVLTAIFWLLSVCFVPCGILLLTLKSVATLAIFSVIPGKSYELYWNGKKMEARQTSAA